MSAVSDLLSNYQHVIADLTLITGGSGVFDVVVDGTTIYSKHETGRHANEGEVLAAFTDFLYQDDGKLHYSIATANAIFYPAAVCLFAYCLKGYRKSVEEIGKWEL